MNILCKHIKKKYVGRVCTNMNTQGNYVNLIAVRFIIFLHLEEVTAQRVLKL